MSLDTLVLSIPTRVVSRCVSLCEGVLEVRAETGRATILQAAFALAATHDVSRTLRPAARDPVRYGPILSLGIRGTVP